MMNPLEFDGERDLEGTMVLDLTQYMTAWVSNIEYGRKEEKTQIDMLTVILKKFLFVYCQKKWVS